MSETTNQDTPNKQGVSRRTVLKGAVALAGALAAHRLPEALVPPESPLSGENGPPPETAVYEWLSNLIDAVRSADGKDHVIEILGYVSGSKQPEALLQTVGELLDRSPIPWSMTIHPYAQPNDESFTLDSKKEISRFLETINVQKASHGIHNPWPVDLGFSFRQTATMTKRDMHGFDELVSALIPLIDTMLPEEDRSRLAQLARLSPEDRLRITSGAHLLDSRYSPRNPLIYTYSWIAELTIPGHQDILSVSYHPINGWTLGINSNGSERNYQIGLPEEHPEALMNQVSDLMTELNTTSGFLNLPIATLPYPVEYFLPEELPQKEMPRDYA